LVVENANGMRKMAATSQELTASSAKLEDTLRQLSESITASSGSGRPLDAFRAKIQNISEAVDEYGGPAAPYLPTLTAGLLLALSAVSDALAGEPDKIRENYDNALRTLRSGSARSRQVTCHGPAARADKITRDKIASVRTSLKGGRKRQEPGRRCREGVR